MFSCLLCNKELTTLRGVAIHAATMHAVSAEAYYRQLYPNQDKEHLCICGKPLSFRNVIVGFRKFCSRQCSGRAKRETQWSPEREQAKPINSRICDGCRQSYQPDNGRQRWCSACGLDKDSRYRLAMYGLTKQDYDTMLFNQNGKCYLCDNSSRLYVDHCHKSGKVRGLLCPGCNTALNRVEIEDWVDKAKEYLRKCG